MIRRLCLVSAAVSLAGCAQLQNLGLVSKGRQPLNEGVRLYNDGQYAAAAKDLHAALDQGLTDRDQAQAHKYLAFIHCSAGRTSPCREEFRSALSANPELALTAAESGHPVWGPIFRSVKTEGGSLSAGLKLYEEGDYDASAKSLQAAIDRGLPDKERADAHKHLAFIHCSAERESACRDEFRKALAIDPALQLAPAEAGHPVWGPVFRAAKAEGAPLSVGVKQYEEGNYDTSAKSLQAAIDHGLPEKDLADAHKYLAFIHCASNRQQACRDEFRKALAVDPALELTPAEAGHPVWGPIFRSLKAKR
jgi:Tfp pilus assembly protein PilF